MTRAKREHTPQAVYWVDVEGVNEIEAFASSQAIHAYIDVIFHYAEKYQAQVLGFMVEDNQAHILMKVQETPLSKIMQCIQQAYSKHYNRDHGRKGAVFTTRYDSYRVAPDKIKMATYHMAQLPLIKKMPKAMLYEGSFFRYLMPGARLAYDLYFNPGGPRDFESLKKDFHKGVLAEKKLVKEDFIVFDRGQSKHKFVDIVEFFIKSESIDRDKLRSNTKAQPYATIKKAIILLAQDYTCKSQHQMADYFNVSEPTVSKIINGCYHEDERVKALIEEFEKESEA